MHLLVDTRTWLYLSEFLTYKEWRQSFPTVSRRGKNIVQDMQTQTLERLALGQVCDRKDVMGLLSMWMETACGVRVYNDWYSPTWGGYLVCIFDRRIFCPPKVYEDVGWQFNAPKLRKIWIERRTSGNYGDHQRRRVYHTLVSLRISERTWEQLPCEIPTLYDDTVDPVLGL